jgi:Bacterial Ig-like domain (group 3)
VARRLALLAAIAITLALCLSRGSLRVSAIVSCAGTFTTAGETPCQIPANAATISITATGGYGGDSLTNNGALGGAADRVHAEFALPINGIGPAGTLFVEVAGVGGNSVGTGAGASGANGGAIGGATNGAGGGGASDVRTCSISMCAPLTSGNDTRQVVAAGGGGGGGGGGNRGGNGGNARFPGATPGGGAAGGGAGTAIGGAAGPGSGTAAGSGTAGAIGIGGAGGVAGTNCSFTGCGAGGGGAGGLYGGGGGGGGGDQLSGGGGGGGSDFVSPAASTSMIVTGVTSSPSVEMRFTFLVTTSVVLMSAPNPSNIGQPVTFAATVTCNGGSTMATGTVTFTIDGAPGSPQPLSGSPAVATFMTGGLAIGNHPATAAYSGDSNCAASTSTGITQMVTMAGAGTTLTSSANPSAPGQPVTFTATVTCNFTPTGTLTIDGVAGTPVTLSGGTATLTTSSLSPGSHTVTAAYFGDANCAASTSSTFTQLVGTAGTSVALTSSQNPSTQGQSVTFTATVSCSFTPTGTMTFTVDGTAGTAVTLSGGTATFTTTSLTTGSHSVTVAYSGDGNCGPATSTVLTQVVNAAPAQSTEQPVGYGYCYPAANAPPPGAPCTPYTGTGAYQSPAQNAFQYCTTVWQAVAQQQACIAQALGNVGGFICAIGCGPTPGETREGARPSPTGTYCTTPDGSRQWVPQGSAAPAGCT